MAQQGLFGEITHVKGAYNHCLQEYWDDYNADWRIQYNINNRGDVYPTHGMGPACQLLNIHRGDRMKYLVAMDSDPFRMGPACQLLNIHRGDRMKYLVAMDSDPFRYPNI